MPREGNPNGHFTKTYAHTGQQEKNQKARAGQAGEPRAQETEQPRLGGRAGRAVTQDTVLTRGAEQKPSIFSKQTFHPDIRTSIC